MSWHPSQTTGGRGGKSDWNNEKIGEVLAAVTKRESMTAKIAISPTTRTLNVHRKAPSEASTRELRILANHTLVSPSSSFNSCHPFPNYIRTEG